MASLWRRLVDGTRRVWHAPDWPAFAGPDWPDQIMSAVVTDRLHAKQGRSVARWTLHADGRRLVVYLKRHYRLPKLAGWLAALVPSRAWSPGRQEWHHLERAAGLGLPVPRAVAAGEFVGPWGRLQSFLAVEELGGMLPLHEAVPLAAKRLSAAAFADWKRRLIAELVRLTRTLHDAGWYHNDLYLCHFYIAESETLATPSDWRDRVYVIDFHRFSQHRIASFPFRVKDLAQLLYSSSVPGVTARDRVLFWRLYKAGRSLRWLRQAVVWKSRRYRRHNDKKRVK